ncbi:MAG: rod shape-determining protein MreC, partial [Synergistaceae bacterium]|nr:rod shape-determining protein MreC [Synergistaceae bacterium]
MKDRIDAGLDAALREARVTLRAPSSWWNEIRIARGGRDDITEGLPVFNNGFLIGRISSVSLMSSWAELLTSPSLMLPVVIEETRELGIIEGDGAGRILLQYIPVG